ncbi:FAD/NAD(P)-binding oxidoreductase [Actinidia rufa]|uniref:FAD/NAD(P)-binding oxidoreductase n=1 Tax=Actinidia rufa TaxID=165716 RepID=A0A7J0HEK3_9ERIC|nr:FAD/NAD(P)-binding oxidoreductase [Actinidia rufa]
MSMTLSRPSLSLHPSLSHESPHHRPVAFLRRRPHHRPRPLSVSVSAVTRQDTATISKEITTWTSAPLAEVRCAGERLCYVNVDLAKSPDLVADFVTPGQYVQIRIPPALVDPPPSPAYFYIASPVGSRREFQFLVKSVPGKTAGVLCTLKKGDVVELSEIDGNGFDIDQLSPPEDYPTVLLFTTGYGISPVRSLIETGFSAHKRSDERIKIWQDSGVKVTQVLSDPPPHWTGARGHVQNVYLNDKPIANPKAAVAVLSGNPNMIELFYVYYATTCTSNAF